MFNISTFQIETYIVIYSTVFLIFQKKHNFGKFVVLTFEKTKDNNYIYYMTLYSHNFEKIKQITRNCYDEIIEIQNGNAIAVTIENMVTFYEVSSFRTLQEIQLQSTSCFLSGHIFLLNENIVVFHNYEQIALIDEYSLQLLTIVENEINSLGAFSYSDMYVLL